jgi:hypothetical protein
MAVFVRTQEAEHDIGESGSFTLRVTSADAELRGVDGSTARMRATFELRAGSEAEADELFELARLEVTTGPGVMKAIEPRDLSSAIASLTRLAGAPSGVRQMRVEAEVPRRAQVRFVGVSADVTSTGVAGAQEYQTVSGDLVISDAADSLRVKSVSGDLAVRGNEPIDIEANSVSGDLYVAAPRLDRLAINTVSGNIEVEGELSPDAAHRAETVSGDFRLGTSGDLTLEVRGLSTDVGITLPHRAEGSRDRRRYVIGNGAASLAFSSMSGDVSIRSSRLAPHAPPAGPSAPAPPEPPAPPASPTPGADRELDVLRALERGEIDVDEAARRLGRGE